MFVIQVNNNNIITDVGRAIIEANEFKRWCGQKPVQFRFQSTTEAIQQGDIPVGTIEWTECVSGRNLNPTNLPSDFCKYPFVCRRISILDRPNLGSFFVKAQIQERISDISNKKYFIKSASGIKKYDPILTRRLIDVPEDTLYFVSEEVDIDAEWRAFVFQNEILDVKIYRGNWENSLTDKEVQFFKNQIQQANLPFQACVVDFARTNNGIEWIEIHNFISCGLYGFDDPMRILSMTKLAWEDELKN